MVAISVLSLCAFVGSCAQLEKGLIHPPSISSIRGISDHAQRLAEAIGNPRNPLNAIRDFDHFFDIEPATLNKVFHLNNGKDEWQVVEKLGQGAYGAAYLVRKYLLLTEYQVLTL